MGIDNFQIHRYQESHLHSNHSNERVRLKADDPQGWKRTILKRTKADDPGWKRTILGWKRTIPQKADDLSAKADDLLRKSRRSLGQSRRSWAKADDLKGWKRTILSEIFTCKNSRSQGLKADDPIWIFLRVKTADLKGWKRTILSEIFMCESRRSMSIKLFYLISRSRVIVRIKISIVKFLTDHNPNPKSTLTLISNWS